MKSESLQFLNHNVIGTMPLRICGFGGSHDETCDIVEVFVRLENRVMRLKLISTKGLSDINVEDHYSFSDLLEKRGLSQVQPSDSL